MQWQGCTHHIGGKKRVLQNQSTLQFAHTQASRRGVRNRVLTSLSKGLTCLGDDDCDHQGHVPKATKVQYSEKDCKDGKLVSNA
jgi:hypothetical protein